MQFGSALTRRTDENGREPRLKSHCDKRRLAIARDAFNADLLRIDRGIGFQIVEPARGAPSPGPQGSPIVRLSRLTAIREADDSARQPRTVVGLNAGRRDCRIAPAGFDQFFVLRWAWRTEAFAGEWG